MSPLKVDKAPRITIPAVATHRQLRACGWSSVTWAMNSVTHPVSSFPSWPALRAWTSALPPPVVIFNKSHSGSRLLAELVRASGFHMGAHQNESGDAEDVLELVEYAVEHYYPDFSPLWREGADQPDEACALIARVFHSHLGSREGERWGWKLCETTYILPLIDYLFPRARYLHLIRDGRDVAFSNHVPPFNRFWQKVYTDCAGLRYWHGMWFGPLSKLAYRIDPLPYNVQHWINSVTVGRRFGAMLRERYMETRYEELCLHFDQEALRILSFIEAPDQVEAIDALRARISTAAIGKYRRHPFWQRWRAEQRARPLLTTLGYLSER